MADINVRELRIENGANQILGDPFEVSAVVNNLELLGPAAWSDKGCTIDNPDGVNWKGHKAEVELELLRDGSIVESRSESVCAPVEGAGADDPILSWTLEPDEPGRYDVRATVNPQPTGPPDTETYSIEVSEVGEQEEPGPRSGGDGGDGGGGGDGLPPLGDADNDGHRNFVDPAPRDPTVPADGPMEQLDKAVLLLGLLIVAWLASSASDTVEAVA